jgi:hypothetical protein
MSYRPANRSTGPASLHLHTAQAFEALSAGLTGAVNGAWQVADADQASGIMSFISGGEQWNTRRTLARDFWVDEHADPRSNTV